MISTRLEEALNKQINAELYSAYLYLSMAAYFETINLPGFANWMRAQDAEERSHAMKIFDYLHERGGQVKLTAIDAPSSTWDSIVAVFEDVHKHEQYVTSLINDLVDLAAAEKDHAAGNFLQWFVAEQVEEEATADGLLQQLLMIKDAPAAIYMLDKELGQRVFEENSSGDFE